MRPQWGCYRDTINNLNEETLPKYLGQQLFSRTAAAANSTCPTTLSCSTTSVWGCAGHTLLPHSTGWGVTSINTQKWAVISLSGLVIAVTSSIFWNPDYWMPLLSFILQTAAETRHQTHFLFILPQWVQLSLCLWRAPCLLSQRPFPWPSCWHLTVIHRLSEQIGFSDRWLGDWLELDQSRMICLITTYSVR